MYTINFPLCPKCEVHVYNVDLRLGYTVQHMLQGGSDFPLIFWCNWNRTPVYFCATLCNLLHNVSWA